MLRSAMIARRPALVATVARPGWRLVGAHNAAQSFPQVRRGFTEMVRPVLRARKAAIKLTPAAANRIKELLGNREEPALGIRLGIRQRGCNGLTYTMDYAEKKEKFQEVVEEHDVKVYIEPKALMFLLGTTMDFVDDRLRAEFVFTNPNSKGECGCGESFNV